ncbi:MAG: PQQ-binding-like beta-propeller repeat protein [Thermoguttaceae bacterium]
MMIYRGTIVTLLLTFAVTFAADQPQWGEMASGNLASREVGLPASFDAGQRNSQTGEVDPATTRNVRWTAKIGPVCYGTPVVAEGRVLVGTNETAFANRPELAGDRGVLQCRDEKTGELVWELNCPKRWEVKFGDWHNVGISSPPSVENGKAYLVTNRCEVVCLDMNGMADGNDGEYQDEGRHCVDGETLPITPHPQDADILWLTDLVTELGVQPHNAANSRVLIDGDLIYVCTSNGVDWTHSVVLAPDAPSLVCIDKKTGKILARDDFKLGGDIVHGQWSSPTLGIVGDKRLIFQGTGTGHLFACETLSDADAASARREKTVVLLKNVWSFCGEPLAQTDAGAPPRDHQHDTTSYEVVANPVVNGEKVFVVFTQELYHNMPAGWLVCLDATLTGDTTRSGGLVWSYRDMTSSGSTVAVADGLLYVADGGTNGTGTLHCLDAATGKPYWKHKLSGAIWGSPLVADGKVYIGTLRREMHVLRHSQTEELLARIKLPDQLATTPTAANGRIYFGIFGTLYCCEETEAK